jgi:hypothetical protein
MSSPKGLVNVPICSDYGIAKGIDALRLRLPLYLRQGRPIFLFLEFATHLVCGVLENVGLCPAASPDAENCKIDDR